LEPSTQHKLEKVKDFEKHINSLSDRESVDGEAAGSKNGVALKCPYSLNELLSDYLANVQAG
jgi:hypothetical protein